MRLQPSFEMFEEQILRSTAEPLLQGKGEKMDCSPLKLKQINTAAAVSVICHLTLSF